MIGFKLILNFRSLNLLKFKLCFFLIGFFE